MLLMNIFGGKKKSFFSWEKRFQQVFFRIFIFTKCFKIIIFTKTKKIFKKLIQNSFFFFGECSKFLSRCTMSQKILYSSFSLLSPIFSVFALKTGSNFKKFRLFHPFLNQYMEEVAKPMSELDLTTEEIVFCMVNILGYDGEVLNSYEIEKN